MKTSFLIGIILSFQFSNAEQANQRTTGERGQISQKEFNNMPEPKTRPSPYGFGMVGGGLYGYPDSNGNSGSMSKRLNGDGASSTRDIPPSNLTSTQRIHDESKLDEFKCPAGQTNPPSMGFTLKGNGSVFVGTARFANGVMTEFAGTIAESSFDITTQGLSGGSGSYKNQGSTAEPPKPINPKAPPAGARIGLGSTTTISALVETNQKSPDFGSLKSFQYRIGNEPNFYVDLKKKAQDSKPKPKKTKSEDDEDDDDSFSEEKEYRSDDYSNSVKTTLMAYGRKIIEYQFCCPNENLPACRKKIKEARAAAEDAENERKNNGPKEKPIGFKDLIPSRVPSR